MDTYTKISSPEVFFLADSHFKDRRRDGETERRRLFVDFLSGVPAGAAVFLLGDVFDFYFEYRSVVPKRYFDVLHALYDCIRRGAEIHFLGGNHDYWFGPFLREDIGLIPHGNDVFVECQGRKIWCTHGDLFMPGDTGYSVIRSFLRNRLVVAAAKILHPDLMDAIASRVSEGSKNRNRRSAKDMAYKFAARPAESFFCRGNDVFVTGHIHYPLHQIKQGKDLVIVGDWITQFTFARLRDGKMSIETFTHGGKD